MFPEPVRFQGRTIGWKRADIEKWLSENS
ncbi:AlpA family phage regulatory protein [Vibrio aestuarianus]|nr:AlpA family phage regulatory protein [Vibrio aestuarianus]